MRNHNVHSGCNGIGNNYIGIITAVSQQNPGKYPLNQTNSFLAISLRTICM